MAAELIKDIQGLALNLLHVSLKENTWVGH